MALIVDLKTLFKAYKYTMAEKVSDILPDDPLAVCLNKPKDDRGNTVDAYSRFFSYMVEANNFAAFPKILPDGKYRRLPNIVCDDDWNVRNVETLYHGFRSYDHGAAFLTDFRYHYGYGRSQGTFFSTIENEALVYTWVNIHNENENINSDKGKILKCKVMSVNGTDYNYIRSLAVHALETPQRDYLEEFKDEDIKKIEELQKFCFKDNLTSQDFEDYENFYRYILTNQDIFALYLGYDFLTKDKAKDVKHYIVFNRGCLVVPSSEVKKFCDKSDNYKGLEYINE